MQAEPMEALQGRGSVIDDMMFKLLAGWAGLRLYVERRRAGCAPDETMDTLLRELLRLDLGEQADVGAVMLQMLGARQTSPAD